MSGIGTYGLTGPSGLVASYVVLAPAAGYEAPDETIGFLAKSAGDVTFTTVRHPGTELTFTLTANEPFPAEAHIVSAWSGTAGDLYACIR